MTSVEGTATSWQDPNSGLRRHKLMTKEIGRHDSRPSDANENVEDYDSVLAHIKLFSPYATAGAGS